MNSPLLYRKVLRRLRKEQYLKTTFDSSRRNEVNWFPVRHEVNVIHIDGITQNEERMKYVESLTHETAINISFFFFFASQTEMEVPG